MVSHETQEFNFYQFYFFLVGLKSCMDQLAHVDLYLVSQGKATEFRKPSHEVDVCKFRQALFQRSFIILVSNRPFLVLE